jgi:hypothetical protein
MENLFEKSDNLHLFTKRGGVLNKHSADPHIFKFLINMVVNDDWFFRRWVAKQFMEDQRNIIYEYINKNFMDDEGRALQHPLISKRVKNSNGIWEKLDANEKDIFDVMMRTYSGKDKNTQTHSEKEEKSHDKDMVEKFEKNGEKWRKLLAIPEDLENITDESIGKDEHAALRKEFANYVISIFAYISRIYSRENDSNSDLANKMIKNPKVKVGGGKIQKGGANIIMYVIGIFTCFMTYCQISTWMSLHVSRQARTYEWKIKKFQDNLEKHYEQTMWAIGGLGTNVFEGCKEQKKLSGKETTPNTQKTPNIETSESTTPPNAQLVKFFQQGTTTIASSGILGEFKKSMRCIAKNITKAVSEDIYKWGKDIAEPLIDSPENEKRGYFEGWFEKFATVYGAFENPKAAVNQVANNVVADGKTIILEAERKGFALSHMTKEGMDLISQLTKVGTNGIIKAISYSRWMLFVEHIGWNIFSAGMEDIMQRRETRLVPRRASGVLTNYPFPAHYGIYFGPRSQIAAFLFQVGWRSSTFTWQNYVVPGISSLYRGLYFSQPPHNDLDKFENVVPAVVPAVVRQHSSPAQTNQAKQDGIVENIFTPGAVKITSTKLPDDIIEPILERTMSNAVAIIDANATPKTDNKTPASTEDTGATLNTNSGEGLVDASKLLMGGKTRKKRRKKNKTKQKRSKRRKSRKKRKKKKTSRRKH